MAENKEQEGEDIDAGMEIKVEPTMQCYVVEEEQNNRLTGFENAVSLPSNTGDTSIWTSKATTCLISQYKKYRSMVGQTTQMRSLREMFETISLEMRNYGFYFNPQKCENKWRVLERKYKNLTFRERLKKPGRMRHYGYWEHKRALDEIFNEKKRHMYLDKNDYSTASGSTKYPIASPKSTGELENGVASNQQQDNTPTTISSTMTVNTSKRNEENLNQEGILTTVFEKFLDELGKNFAMVERNMERRHKEEMAMRQKELEVNKKLLKLKELKIELQKSQILAAAQLVHLDKS